MIKKYCLLPISCLLLVCFGACTHAAIEDFEICGGQTTTKYQSYYKVCNKRTGSIYLCKNPSDMGTYFSLDEALMRELEKSYFFQSSSEARRSCLIDSIKTSRVNTFLENSGDMEFVNYVLREIKQTQLINLHDTTHTVIRWLTTQPLAMSSTIYNDICFSSNAAQWQKILSYYLSDTLIGVPIYRENEACVKHCLKAKKILKYCQQYNNKHILYCCLHHNLQKEKMTLNADYGCMDVFIQFTQYKNENGMVQLKKEMLNPESLLREYYELE